MTNQDTPKITQLIQPLKYKTEGAKKRHIPPAYPQHIKNSPKNN